MKLSDYGKKVSEQAYYIDLASKNVNAMYYKSIPDDVEISLERSIGKDYIYDMYKRSYMSICHRSILM